MKNKLAGFMTDLLRNKPVLVVSAAVVVLAAAVGIAALLGAFRGGGAPDAVSSSGSASVPVSGTAQDLAKQRRTEVDYFNGYIASRGQECGMPAPTHAALATMIQKIERGELLPSEANLAELLSDACTRD